MIYPWQQSLWEALTARPLPSALLLVGREGIGKFSFARALAKRVLCENATSCGQCQSCRWLELAVHPGYHLLEPEEEEAGTRKTKSRVIKVEQVRGLKERAAIASSGPRVFVVHPAEAMNASAQSALLKILEEPPYGALCILVANRSYTLLPTILSRCCRISMPNASFAVGLAWLRQQNVEHPESALAAAGDAPLLALEIAHQESVRTKFVQDLNDCMDPIALAQILQRFDAGLAVHWLQQWAYDLMLYQSQKKIRYNIAHQPRLQEMARRVTAKRLHHLQRELLAASRIAAHALNPALFMEQVSFSYWRYTKND
jgi:DNA polymerase-3 subunit delta'